MAKPGKIELPLARDEDFADLAQQHDACTLSYVNWTHRAHIAVALYYLYLQNMSLDAVIEKLRRNIHAYNKAKGDGMGYNETITVVFMKKIHAELQSPRSLPSLVDELERLLDICTIDWLYHYYSPHLIWSEKAKQGWVEPDIKALDF